MNEDWEELNAAARREAEHAYHTKPLSPATKDVIASIFRGARTPWRTNKLRGKK